MSKEENAPRYFEVSEEFIQFFNEIFNKKSFPIDIKFKFLGDTKLKKVVSLAKLSEKIQVITVAQVLVEVNEDLFDKFDALTNTLLIETELDKISINMETGKIKTNKLNLVTSTGVVNKFGIEAVMRANQVEQMAADVDMEFTEQGVVQAG